MTSPTAPAQDDDEASGPAAAVGSLMDPDSGWTTAKVVVLVVVTSLVAVMLTLAVSSRFGSPSEDSVDVGFMQDMIQHHEQAVQLGILGSENASDRDVVHFAREAIVAQQYEIGYMEAILEDWGDGLGDPDGEVMRWMDMPTTLDQMPGMASDDDLAAFRDARGADADAAFLRLMSEHHRGGIHMAEYAADHASDERVVSLAERMARNQAAEIREYAAHAERLGITL